MPLQLIYGNNAVDNGHTETYDIVDNEIGNIFAWQMKLIHRVPYNRSQSIWPNKSRNNLKNLQDLTQLIKTKCSIVIDFDINMDQQCMNKLHEIYEQMHDTKDKFTHEQLILLYEFHDAIHDVESAHSHRTDAFWKIQWGHLAGPITRNLDLYDYYQSEIPSNTLISKWGELGKPPGGYYMDKEPDDQIRVNELIKPHRNFDPTFFIYANSYNIETFEPGFEDWWKTYENDWCNHWKTPKWTTAFEYGGIVLAEPRHKQPCDWNNEFPIVTDILFL